MKILRFFQLNEFAEAAKNNEKKNTIEKSKETVVTINSRTRRFVVGSSTDGKEQIVIRLLKDDYLFPNYFQTKVALKELYGLNNIFRAYGTMEQMIQFFISLINSGNLIIGPKKDDNNLSVSFILPESKNAQINLNFKKEIFSKKEYKEQINKGISEIKSEIVNFKEKNGLEEKKEIGNNLQLGQRVEGQEQNSLEDLKREVKTLFNIIETLKNENRPKGIQTSNQEEEKLPPQ